MADYQMTVKGLFALASMYKQEADAITFNVGESWVDKLEQQAVLDGKAQRCRAKAYEMLGVVTIEQPQMTLPNIDEAMVL